MSKIQVARRPAPQACSGLCAVVAIALGGRLRAGACPCRPRRCRGAGCRIPRCGVVRRTPGTRSAPGAGEKPRWGGGVRRRTRPCASDGLKGLRARSGGPSRAYWRHCSAAGGGGTSLGGTRPLSAVGGRHGRLLLAAGAWRALRRAASPGRACARLSPDAGGGGRCWGTRNIAQGVRQRWRRADASRRFAEVRLRARSRAAAPGCAARAVAPEAVGKGGCVGLERAAHPACAGMGHALCAGGKVGRPGGVVSLVGGSGAGDASCRDTKEGTAGGAGTACSTA